MSAAGCRTLTKRRKGRIPAFDVAKTVRPRFEPNQVFYPRRVATIMQTVGYPRSPRPQYQQPEENT